jgi:site-specific DNA-methyltransferase (adenine-specific)
MSNNYNLILGDSTEQLKQLEPNSFDAVICDPPYGMDMDIWDKNVPPVDIWQEVYRVAKPGSFLISFCSPQLYHRMAVNIEDAGYIPRDMIFWMNTTKMAKKNRLKPAHEPIMVAQKPLDGSIKHNQETWGCGVIDTENTRIPWDKPPADQPVGGHLRRGFGKEVDKFAGGTQPANQQGRYPSNIIGHFDNEEHQKYFYAPRATRKERGEYNDHPTPKPIALMRYLVRIYSPLGGHVLDPFNGSGGTAIGSLQEKRTYTGVDLDQHYLDITHRRIKDHCQKTQFDKLFDYD